MSDKKSTPHNKDNCCPTPILKNSINNDLFRSYFREVFLLHNKAYNVVLFVYLVLILRNVDIGIFTKFFYHLLRQLR